MRLKNRVAIVTGSGSGLGETMVKRLAEEGASVVVADIDQQGIDRVVGELKAAGRTAIGYKVDVTNRAQLDEFMKAVAKDFGRIDILVNNAGVVRHRPFLSMGTRTCGRRNVELGQLRTIARSGTFAEDHLI